jgi:hexokinase
MEDTQLSYGNLPIHTLEEFIQPFIIDDTKLDSLTTHLAAKYKKLALESEEQFLATPVTCLPTGREKGEFLAIDFGGSNLRVAFVELLGEAEVKPEAPTIGEYNDRVIKTHEKSWPIDDRLKSGHPDALFAWVGECLAEVIRDRYGKDCKIKSEIPLGVTFSFPMK